MEEFFPFFVYGTLRNGQNNYEYYFKNKTKKEYPAWVRGTLYSYGNLPAYMPEGENWIRGDLVYIKDAHYQDVLRDVDFLEGYRPEMESTSLYIRRVKPVFTENQKEVKAWIYIFNYPVSKSLIFEIKSGDWEEYDLEY